MFKNPQRVAWITLLSGFVFFCASCIGMIWMIQFVLYEFTMDLHTTVYVSRGTIGVLPRSATSEQVVRELFTIAEGGRISTDELGQGHLSFTDPLNADTVIATVQLLAGSEVKLNQATRPRFLGEGPYLIQLGDAKGEIEVIVSEGLDRDIRLEIESQGRKVRLDDAGYYLLRADSGDLSVTVRRGQALLIDPNNHTQLVGRSQHGLIDADGVQVAAISEVNLIPNSTFEVHGAGERDVLNWGCTFKPTLVADENGNPIPQPLGFYERAVFQGRPTLHIERRSNQPLYNSETNCSQQNLRLDVTGYESLAIRANMYLVWHSVPNCGEQATECALMLRVRYRNVQGMNGEWIHGFYAYANESLGWPRRCEFCIQQDHERVNAETWYIFESADLIRDLPADQRDALRPIEITSIEFYASGHEYEVYVSEVSLIAQSASAPGVLASP